MQKDPDIPAAEDKEPLSGENKDVNTFITHIVSLAGYELDSMIEIKIPGNGNSKYYGEAVSCIVRKLESALMDITFMKTQKTDEPEDRKRLSVLLDVKINCNENGNNT